MTVAPSQPTRPRPRNYWQLPTFVLGLAAAVAAYAHFPPPPDDLSQVASRDMASLQVHLRKRPLDMPKIGEIASRLTTTADLAPNPHLARLLAGTAYQVLAEYGPPADAPGNWETSYHLLASVDPARLPEPKEDQQRWIYRRVKSEAATGRGDPDELYAVLSKPPLDEDGGGERSRLLGEVCLKLSQPDLKRAKAELGAYLGGPSRLPAAELARLKLKLAEVCAATNDPKKAKEWLGQIGEAAAPEVRGAAHAQLGRMAAKDGNWEAAVEHYQTALAVPELSESERGAIRYQTATALMKRKNPTAAAAYLEQALNDPGPSAAAAAIRLAELALRDPDASGKRGRAVEMLEVAADRAATAGEIIPPAEIQAAFEEAIRASLNDTDFAAAMRAVSAYAKVAPERAAERKAEVNAAWATALQRSGAAEGEVAARFRDAAAAYAELAEAYPTPAGRADLFRKAADCLRQAGDGPAALAALDQVIRSGDTPAEQAAAAWLDMGELLRAEGKLADAEAALRKAMDSPGSAGFTARVKLGLLCLDRGRMALRTGTPDRAEEGRKLLELGQALLTQAANRTPETAAERDSQEQALYELGKLLVQQGHLADAEARFRQMVQANPTGPLAGHAKLYLGSCLLLIARGDGSVGRPPADADHKLTEARELFLTLADNADPFLRTQSEVRLVNAELMLKRYEELPALCDRLAAKHRGRVEELILLSMLYHGQRSAERNADAARTLNRMEEVYERLSDGDFGSGAAEYTREFWKQWFAAVSPSSAGRTQ